MHLVHSQLHARQHTTTATLTALLLWNAATLSSVCVTCKSTWGRYHEREPERQGCFAAS